MKADIDIPVSSADFNKMVEGVFSTALMNAVMDETKCKTFVTQMVKQALNEKTFNGKTRMEKALDSTMREIAIGQMQEWIEKNKETLTALVAREMQQYLNSEYIVNRFHAAIKKMRIEFEPFKSMAARDEFDDLESDQEDE